MNNFLKKIGVKIPIIQGPMAGVSGPNLVAAVSNAGGLGSLGAGYMAPQSITEAIKAIRSLTRAPFAVNLFVPSPFVLDEEKIRISKQKMARYCQDFGIDPSTLPVRGPEDFDEQVAVVLAGDVPIISFTFGIPKLEIIKKIKAKGLYLIGTATTVTEGLMLAKAGFDAIVAQGGEAGGHRGSFDRPYSQSLIGSMALIPSLVDRVSIPVIAAGGIMDGRGLIAALVLGASAVQMGTAFLVCQESGADAIYKKAVLEAKEDETVLTSAFSGKPSRGIMNRFIQEMSPYEDQLPDYPVQHYLTQPLRYAAGKKGNADLLSLWAGQGVRLAKAQSAATLVKSILSQAKALNMPIFQHLEG